MSPDILLEVSSRIATWTTGFSGTLAFRAASARRVGKINSRLIATTPNELHQILHLGASLGRHSFTRRWPLPAIAWTLSGGLAA